MDSNNDSEPLEGVPFSFFCSLLREISRISPQQSKPASRESSIQTPVRVLERWLAELRKRFSPLPSGTVATFFRLLFPQEDYRRKYDIQETRMAQSLASSLGINSDCLRNWAAEGFSGCLGLELKQVLEKSYVHSNGHICPFSLAKIDDLLDELASHSGYSHASIRHKYPPEIRRPRNKILRALYCHLSPEEASFLTQIILKDLRPALYPIAEMHYTSALRKCNTKTVQMLTLWEAMKAWDPRGGMIKCFHIRMDIEETAAFVEQPSYGPIVPKIGTPVEHPKSQKGIGCHHALSILKSSERIWAETKYDGERAQIHVEILPDNTSNIAIFSKSRRDSTQDRLSVHDIIRSALSLSGDISPAFKKGVILDAEMVAWQSDRIDEFWKIRAIIEGTANGIRSRKNASGRTVSERGHLGLVFFDILVLDSVSLLDKPYSHRRKILESLITPLQSKAILSDRYLINLRGGKGLVQLERVFADHIANFQEGLVLKAEEARYHDFRLPWVKIKKDYIEGCGDGLDLVIIGASWEKERARLLRVPPSTFTTFYIGALLNARERQLNPTTQPHFYIYFTVEYGMNRQELEELNFLIKNSDHLTYSATMDQEKLPFKFTVFTGLKSTPAMILRIPLLAELYGAGFDKAPNSEHYELRFPRISKIHRPIDRSWDTCVDLQTIQRTALEAVGKNSPDKDIDDWGSKIFERSSSPCARPYTSGRKDSNIVEIWEEALESVDRQSVTWNGEAILTPRPSAKSLSGNIIGPIFRSAFSEKALATTTKAFKEQSTSIHHQGEDHIPILSSPASPHRKRKLDGDEWNTQKPFFRNRCTAETVIRIENIPADVVFCFWSPTAELKSSSCMACSSWRRVVARSQRLHSVESLLSACGWDDSSALICVNWGILFLHNYEGLTDGGQFGSLLQKFETLRSHRGKPIVVITCKSSASGTAQLEILYELA